ncbi:MAG: DnaB-like helicase C-terminal domain-containing protein [Candidatus Omnitrophota bacterium]
MTNNEYEYQDAPDMTGSESVIFHKTKAENMFCACVLSNAELILHDCRWLDPAIFSVQPLKQFWKDVLEGVQPTEAAINNKVLTQLIKYNSEILSTMDYMAYAQVIADDQHMLSISLKLGPMAKAIGSRDREALNKLVVSLSNEKQVSGYEIPTAYDVALSFAETIGLESQTIQTFVSPYDNAIGGYARGTLNLIAARPSMGKTAIAWQIARNMAASGNKVIYFSLEMTRNALWARAACGAMEYNIKDYYNNKLDQSKISKLIDASASLMNAYSKNLMIDDRSRLTSDDIWKAVATYKPDCIVVDHISLLSDKADNEIKRLGNITWTGKQIAKEYNLVSVYLQQLNRGTESERVSIEAKRPVMSNLRDSGETEQNADTVTFIFRKDYYEVGDPPLISDTELIVAKNRNGERNIVVYTKYHLKRQWFYSRNELEQEATLRATK